MVLIQITINPDHKCKYEEIYTFITKKQKQGTINKYHNFFDKVYKLKLVHQYIFQWMTRKEFDPIKTKTETFKTKYPDSQKDLTIVTHSQDLLEAISLKNKLI